MKVDECTRFVYEFKPYYSFPQFIEIKGMVLSSETLKLIKSGTYRKLGSGPWESLEDAIGAMLASGIQEVYKEEYKTLLLRNI